MPLCARCRSPLVPGARFCDVCGAGVVQAAARGPYGVAAAGSGSSALATSGSVLLIVLGGLWGVLGLWALVASGVGALTISLGGPATVALGLLALGLSTALIFSGIFGLRRSRAWWIAGLALSGASGLLMGTFAGWSVYRYAQFRELVRSINASVSSFGVSASVPEASFAYEWVTSGLLIVLSVVTASLLSFSGRSFGVRPLAR